MIIRRECLTAKQNKVAIISGGGSGHGKFSRSPSLLTLVLPLVEPFAGGFVGAGLLSAAVAGEVFASPSTESVLAAVEACAAAGAPGVLLVVLNYTGDRLCFGAAAAIAKTKVCLSCSRERLELQ